MTMSIFVQNMGKVWYIKWAKYGQDLDQIGTMVFSMYGVYGFVCGICDWYWSKCGITY